MNLDALLRVFYLDVYEFEVYDPFSRPQTRILRGIAVQQKLTKRYQLRGQTPLTYLLHSKQMD